MNIGLKFIFESSAKVATRRMWVGESLAVDEVAILEHS